MGKAEVFLSCWCQVQEVSDTMATGWREPATGENAALGLEMKLMREAGRFSGEEVCEGFA